MTRAGAEAARNTKNVITPIGNWVNFLINKELI